MASSGNYNSGVTSSGYGQRRVKLPGVSRDVEDVLLWRDVKVSGGVFVLSTALYLLLEWSGLSLLTIFSNTLLGLISIAFLWNNVANFTNKPGVPLPAVVDRGVSEGDLKHFAESFTSVINKGLGFTRRLISGKDIVLTVEVAAGLYVFGKIGIYFSSLGLLYTLLILAFTVPKIYELKKDDIDNAVSTAQTHGKKHYSNYVEPYVKKIPRASTSSSSTTSGGGPSQSYSQGQGQGQGYTQNQGQGQGYTQNQGQGQGYTQNQGQGQGYSQGGPTGGAGQTGPVRPSALESDAEYTDIGREAASGLPNEVKKFT